MARDRANIRVDMWGDQDWRDLTGPAQRLYMHLLTHDTLNYAGVAEWRPGRLAAMVAGETVETIETAGAELAEAFFIVIDEGTEEVLVRSFIKHDGLMKQPKLVVAMTNAFSAVASKLIREVIAFEVQKMSKREPELRAWSVHQMGTVLKARGTDIQAFTPAFTPSFTPSGDQAQGLPTSTATTTTTSSKDDGGTPTKEKARSLPDDWAPTEAHTDYAKENGLDLDHEVLMFRSHAEANNRKQQRWNASFTGWLGKAKQWSNQDSRKGTTGSGREARINQIGDFYAEQRTLEIGQMGIEQ